MENDIKTASAFANSWNNLRHGSIYTYDQFVDWFAPINKGDVDGKTILELGCGNGSFILHLVNWQPKKIVGVDLGDSVISAKHNLSALNIDNWEIIQSDILNFISNGFDIVYCIGVLHHMTNPQKGFEAVLKNTKSGGRFHCWVYAKEGNGIIIWVVDPIRKIVSKFPWWITKYMIATPLVIPYFFYAKILKFINKYYALKFLPLFQYSLWIAERNFYFFRHVAFDQLVTPQTTYICKENIIDWLTDERIEPSSIYITMRNGNSWKFGGILK